MFLKRMCRKPFLPLLLLISILAGILFPAVLSQSIEAGYAEINQLYKKMTIECNLLPQTQTVGSFSLETDIGEQIARLDAVSEYYCELKCPYYFRNPGPSSGNSTAYGTNDIDRFAREHELTCEFSEKYGVVDFNSGENICIVSKTLLDIIKRNIGDTITVAGSEKFEKKNENAPDVTFTIVGTFESEETEIPWNAMVVPSECFFDIDKLLTTPDGIRKWRVFTAFDFIINPSYNKKFDSVKEELEDIIGEEWMLYSTSRKLYNAVRPLEKKLDMQKMMYNLVTCLLLFLPALLVVLMCLKEKNEVLVRILHGEKISHVFLTNWIHFAGIILIFAGISVMIVGSFCRMNLWYVVGMIVVPMFAAAVTIGTACRKKLVILYQSREG